MTETYILDKDGNPIPEPDILKWGKWFEKADRHIATTEFSKAHISTVFLGIDHSLFTGYPPILFETMIFWTGHELDQEQMRYSTREEALIGHEVMVKMVREALKKEKP